MYIDSLDISNLRIVKDLRIDPSPGVNFIVGDNGAGKTSILEAIYLAGRGKTFRHSDAGPMIRQGADNVTVVVGIKHEGHDHRSTLGIRREKRLLTCRLDGVDVKKRSSLAEALPVQWVGSQPQLLLSMGPEVRRRFLDMGLFHVEPSYFKSLVDFQRTLRQRNAAIRQGNTENVNLWNQAFALAAEMINTARERFISNLMEGAAEELVRWQTDFKLGYRFRRGWKSGTDLFEQLNANSEMDLRMGYTTRGPQRADLEIHADSALAEKKLSRGQQKILVMALNLSLNDLIRHQKAQAPILLVDDLSAELDPRNRGILLSEIGERSCQAFLTKIEERSLSSSTSDSRTFHVEHGAIR